MTLIATTTGGTTIESLSDVVVTSPTIGQTLEWNGTDWVNSTPVIAYGFRNLVINGDFKVAQRSTSGALTSTTGSYPSVDRWMIYQGGSANGIAAQVASGLPGFQYALMAGRTVGATTTGDIWIGQVFETENSIPYQGQSVTFSFYVKAGTNFSGTTLLYSSHFFTALWRGRRYMEKY